MRAMSAITIAGMLVTLTACSQGPVIGYSASTPERERVTLICGDACGWISSEDTSWKYDARCDVNSVILDPGRYEIGLWRGGGCDYPLWWKSPYYSSMHVRFVSGHSYELQNRDGALWIVDKATGQPAVYEPPVPI
jgi:hypothetical protein